MADPAKVRDGIENAPFLLAHGDQGRILRYVDPKRVIGRNCRLERIRKRGEGDRDLYSPPDSIFSVLISPRAAWRPERMMRMSSQSLPPR